MNAHSARFTVKSLALACCLTAALAAAPARAGLIADFIPGPASALVPEFVWTGQEFLSGAGAYGTNFGLPGPGDGQLAPGLQAAPGLVINTPYAISGVPGSVISGSTTTFYDATLQIVPTGQALLGFPAAGPGDLSFGQASQPLAGAIVRLWSTDPTDVSADQENPVLLLQGVVTDAVITGINGASSGATLSANVVYTGGLILQAAGWQSAPGAFSWSLLDIAPPLGISPQTGLMIPFEANGVGQFSAVPEPASLSLLSLGALAMFRRRRAG